MGKSTDADALFRSALAIHRAASTRDPANARTKCEVVRLTQSLTDASAGRSVVSSSATAPCRP
jgi:hypothetical protein